MADFGSEFDAYLDKKQAAAPSLGDQFDSYLDKRAQEEGALRTNVESALQTTPQKVAQRKYLSQVTGIPEAAIETDEGQVQAIAKYREISEQAKFSPVLRARLQDPTFTPVAIDDVPALSKIEQAIGGMASFLMGADGKGGLPGVVGRGAQKGYYGSVKGTSGAFRALTETLAAPLNALGLDNVTSIGGNPLQRLAEGFGMIGQRAGKNLEGIKSPYDGNLAAGAEAGFASLTQNTKYMPLLLAGPVGATAALLGMAAESGGVSYQSARGKGVGHLQSTLYGLSDAAIEFATEKLPMQQLIGDVAKNTSIIKTLLKQVALEVPGEQIATALQDVNEWAVLHPEKTLGDYIGERPDAAVQTLVATIVGTGGNVVLTKGLDKLLDGSMQREMQAQLAMDQAQQLQELMKIASGSNLRELDPETFKSYVQAAAENTPGAPKTVHIDGQVLMQALGNMAPEELQQLLPSVASQLDAAQINTPIEIPISELATALPGTPLEQKILPHLRLDGPDSLSQVEAEQAQTQARELLEKKSAEVMQQATDSVKMAQSAQYVHDQMYSQLMATGRMSDDVARKGSALVREFYTVMAATLNTTPQKLYDDMLTYRVKAQRQGKGQVLNAPAINVQMDGRTVPISMGPQDSARGYTLVPVETANFDAAFKGDENFYVGPQGEGGIAGRYERFGEFQKSAQYIEASSVSVNANGRIMFGNGRHRYAFMRDQGLANIPVAMDEESLANAVKFGYVNEGVLNQTLPGAWPTSMKVTADINNVTVPDLANLKNDAGQYESAVNAVAAEPGMRTGLRNLDRKAEAIIQKMVDNLVWLHDQMPPEIRQRAKLWYDGAQRIAEKWAGDWGKTRAQTAGMLAVLSPQKDWFMNTTMAERVGDVLNTKMDHAWDAKMNAAAFKFLAKDVAKTEGREGDEAKNLAAYEKIKGKTLAEAIALGDKRAAGIWVRAYDEAYHASAHAIISPEGNFENNKLTAQGKEARRAWGDFSAIGKAASIFVDGSATNINEQIGGEHKVRNFYNNIFNASDARFTTIDTHAVAAALLRPLAGADRAVADNFGATGGTNVTGVSGSYPLYYEAYKRAAAQVGVLPREMQSITWEAVRGLFTEGFKKESNKQAVDALWAQVDRGQLSLDDARKTILEMTGGIQTPDWWGNPGSGLRGKTYEQEREAHGGTKINFEVAPDPRNEELKARWDALPQETRVRISHDIAWSVAAKALAHFNDANMKGELHLQMGGWMADTNPSLSLWMEPNASGKKIMDLANLLGYALNQEGMMVTSPKKLPGSALGGVVVVHGVDVADAKNVYNEVRESVRAEDGSYIINGHSTGGGSMAMLVPKEQAEAIAQRIGALLGDRHDVGHNDIHVAWPEKGENDYGLYREDQSTGGSPLEQAADNLRAEAAQRLADALNGTGESPDQLYQLPGDRAGRYASGGLAPLEGAPSVPGFNGPDSRLVAVAEQYARDNGIPLRRQAEYVRVDEDRARRIAQAYAEMEHAPQDPKVKEAYENMIQQALAQYRALEQAGYKFWFIDMGQASNAEYASTPWNAMRDIRANQQMGVFPTADGFGSSDLDVSGNPLLADTGIQWPVGGPDGPMAPVLANDIFRAVHDAFGHGLEGSGFRAQGEENAWQAHARLFTGSALGALTSETRGQNSWLNFGPNGESNRTAKVEDTVFADQKTGLMPEWTWTEGMAPNMPAQVDMATVAMPAAQGVNKYQEKYLQGRDPGALNPEEREQYDALTVPQTDALEQDPNKPLGTFDPRSLTTVINENANLSTFLHETGHFFLEALRRMAMQPTAPARVQEMYAQSLKGLGVTAKQWEKWHADFEKTGKVSDGMRAAHEKWAETFEVYLFEGKAPNKDMANLFRVFSSWLKRVYTSIKEFSARTGTTLNKDLTNVMDRMLASDEQIAEAEELAGLVPDLDATADAQEKLRSRSMRDLQWSTNAVNRWIKRLQQDAKANRKEVEAEVTLEVNQSPEMRAKAALEALKVAPEYQGQLDAWKAKRATAEEAARKQVTDALVAAEETTNGPLKGLKKGQFLAKTKKDVANQVEAKMIEWDRANPKPARPYVGTDADVMTIADSFGFESVEQMLQAINDFGKAEDVIEGMTDQRMLERYGDLSDEDAIRQAAIEAVHNEARAKSLATELAAQRDMLNPRRDTGGVNAKGQKITVNALVEAAKLFAANVIGKRKIGDLKKAAWAHLQAERRAGKEWEAATAKGDTAAAVVAKQNQVLNNAAVAEAAEAQASVAKALEFFAKVMKGNNEDVVTKGRDPDVVNAARAILAVYGFAPFKGKSAMEYLELVQQNDPAMYAALEPSVRGAMASAKPLKDLTVDELNALSDEIGAMWHLAKSSRQYEVDGNKMDIQDAADALSERMQEKGVPTRVPGEGQAVTEAEEAKGMLQFAGALLRRVEQWAESMDGKFGGPFLRLVFQPVKEAADRYRAERITYRKELAALVDNLRPVMKEGVIDAPELGYTFGKGKGNMGQAELLGAIIHLGNDSNKRKLLLGRNWATENEDGTLNADRWDAFLKRAVDQGLVTKAHFDFAQGVWDLLERMKPLAQKTHRDVFGRYFAEVTSTPFEVPGIGFYRGGYVPAITDPRIVKDNELRKLAELENENMSFAFPSTNKGFTKSRTEYNRPLMLDIGVLGQHIDKVLLFSHMEPAVRGVTKVLSQKGVAYQLNRVSPAAISGMLTPWLNRSARQIVETPIIGDGRISRVMSVLRQRAGMSVMFANISNTLQQFAGITLAAAKVKPKYLARSMAQYAANPSDVSQRAAQASAFMATRMDAQVDALNSTMEEIMLNPSVYQRAKSWTTRHTYFMQTALDNVIGPVVWNAAYNEGIEYGMTDRDAVRFADSAVRNTQGSTLPEDVSRIETGPAYARVFTQFMGYFNMVANTNVTELQKIAQETGLRKGAGKALGVVFFGLLAPAWIAEAIAQAFKGGPDDEDKDGEYWDDWLMAVFGLGTVKTMLAGVPFLGQFAMAGINSWNDKPYDDRVSMSPAISMLEGAVSAPRSVYKAVVDDGSKQKAVRDVATAVSLATGLPASTLARPLGYLTGMADDRVQPTGPVDMGRGLVTGIASPESK